MKTIFQRTAALLCAALLGWAGYWPVRLARADLLSREPSAGQLAAALRLAPSNAEYWLRWTDLVEESGALAPRGNQRAAELDPYDASVWIRLGLQAEGAGDFETAERYLLRAAAVNRQYGPRWTLANYYFRRGDAAHFWPWAKSGLEWSYGERRPLFDLCWKITEALHISHASELILRNAIPDSAAVRREYLTYLLANNLPDAAEKLAAIIGAEAGPADREPLLQYAGRMLDWRRWNAALAAWNAMCSRKVLPYTALDPQREASPIASTPTSATPTSAPPAGAPPARTSAPTASTLTNPDFQSEPLETGFDWRMPSIPGVTMLRNATPAALRVTFSGKQPERCEVLLQFVPVLSGSRYRLSFEHQTSGIQGPASQGATSQPETGLRWQAFDAGTGMELPGRSTLVASGAWRESTAEFTAPKATTMVRLALIYQRMPGTTRVEGEIWLRNIRLRVAPCRLEAAPCRLEAAL